MVRDVEVAAAVRGIHVTALEKDRLQLVVLKYQGAHIIREMLDGNRNAVLPVGPSFPAQLHTVGRIAVGSVVPKDVEYLVFLMTGLVVRRKPQQVVPDRFHALVVIVGQAAGRVITEDCLETL